VPINSVWLHDCNITVQYNKFLIKNYKKRLFLKNSQLPWIYLWSLTCRRQSKLTNVQYKWRYIIKNTTKFHTFKQTMCNPVIIITNYPCYNGYSRLSRVLLPAQKSWQKLGSEAENGRKWPRHAKLKPCSGGKLVLHECDPLDCEKFSYLCAGERTETELLENPWSTHLILWSARTFMHRPPPPPKKNGSLCAGKRILGIVYLTSSSRILDTYNGYIARSWAGASV
jgi:hypothetical protein